MRQTTFEWYDVVHLYILLKHAP